jgi:hypothetical protein
MGASKGISAGGLDRDARLGRQSILNHEAREAVRAVAALLHLAAVDVEDAITKVDVATLRAFGQQYLIAAHATTAVGEMAYLVGRERDLLTHAVDDDEVVAQAVHLGEGEKHVGKSA